MTGRTLVAGVGNVFLRDDAFGVEVARALAGRPVPDGVEIGDFGIRGVHLVYELLDGCDLFVLVDAARRGYDPGTVTVLEIDPPQASGPAAAPAPAMPLMDAHGLAPEDVFAMLTAMGARPGRTLLVACEPADVSSGMGLSGPVRAAVPHAIRAVEEILEEHGGKEGGADGLQGDRAGSRDGGGRGDSGGASRHQALPGNPEYVARRAQYSPVRPEGG